jgi:hypothetical protein
VVIAASRRGVHDFTVCRRGGLGRELLEGGCHLTAQFDIFVGQRRRRFAGGRQ